VPTSNAQQSPPPTPPAAPDWLEDLRQAESTDRPSGEALEPGADEGIGFPDEPEGPEGPPPPPARRPRTTKPTRVSPEKPGPADERLVGIRGWLILPAIGLVIAPFEGLLTLVVAYSNVREWIPAVLLYLLVSIDLAMIAFTVVVAVFFFNCRKQTRVLVPALLVSNVVLLLLGEILVSSTLDVPFQDWKLVRAVVRATIWVPYFLVSKRVKATFTE
jgi:hypothetical protein